MSLRMLRFLCTHRQAPDPNVHKKRHYTAPGRRHEKSRPLLGGGSQRAPDSTIPRLYYRGEPERIPHLGYFFLARMDDLFTEGMCFDSSTEGERGTLGWRPPSCEGQRGLALRHRTGARRDVNFRESMFHALR